MNAGSRVDHNRFCLHEEWELVSNARGKNVQHHITYELPLPDGQILRTRISRPLKKQPYGAQLWKTILREQLCVAEDEFWDCVRHKQKPDRGHDDQAPTGRSLPAQLVYQLLHVVRLPEDQVRTLSLEEAAGIMATYWSHQAER